jgi:hypothetical protein
VSSPRIHHASSQGSLPEPKASGRLILLDNDIFFVLAATDCFEGTAQLFGLSLAEFRRLSSLADQLRSARFAPELPAHVRKAALDYCGRIRGISGQHDAAVLDRLARHRHVEAGEAQLLAHALQERSALLATADKRFLRALCTAPALAEIRAAIAGRVVCLETLIRMHLDTKGIAAAATKFSAAADYNGTIHLLFGGGPNTAEQHCRDGLRSFLADLETIVGAEFLFSPGARA